MLHSLSSAITSGVAYLPPLSSESWQRLPTPKEPKVATEEVARRETPLQLSDTIRVSLANSFQGCRV